RRQRHGRGRRRPPGRHPLAGPGDLPGHPAGRGHPGDRPHPPGPGPPRPPPPPPRPRAAPPTRPPPPARAPLAPPRPPLVGDRTYGAAPTLAARLGVGRPFLHAWRLAFTHPTTGQRVELTEPLPDDLQSVLDRLRAGRARSIRSSPMERVSGGGSGAWGGVPH